MILMKRVCCNPNCRKDFKCTGLCRDIEKFNLKTGCYCKKCLHERVTMDIEKFRFTRGEMKTEECYDLRKSLSDIEIELIMIAGKL